MAYAVFILAMCFLFVYGFRLMARLDRFLSPSGKESLSQSECAGKPHTFRQFFILYFSGESCATSRRRGFNGFRHFGKKEKKTKSSGQKCSGFTE